MFDSDPNRNHFRSATKPKESFLLPCRGFLHVVIIANRRRIRELKMGYIQEARQNHVKKKVEEALRSKMKQKALKECDQYTSKFAQCASGRTFSVVWLCRKQAKELNNCLHQFTNDAVLEEMKKEYMVQHGGEGSARI